MADQRSDKSANGGRKNGRNSATNGGMRFGRGVFGWVLFIGLVVLLFMLVKQQGNAYVSVPMSDFWTQLTGGNVKELTIDGDEVKGTFLKTIHSSDGKDVDRFISPLPVGVSMNWEFLQSILNASKDKAKVTVNNNQNLLLQVILPLIPWLLIFGFIWFFVFRQLRNSAGAGGMLGNFGRSRHKITSKEHTNV